MKIVTFLKSLLGNLSYKIHKVNKWLHQAINANHCILTYPSSLKNFTVILLAITLSTVLNVKAFNLPLEYKVLVVGESFKTIDKVNYLYISNKKLNSRYVVHSVAASDTLVFRKEKLMDLVTRMEKKYQIKIEIESDRMKEKRFSGTFTTETIHQAMEALKISYPFNYVINDKLVIIKD